MPLFFKKFQEKFPNLSGAHALFYGMKIKTRQGVYSYFVFCGSLGGACSTLAKPKLAKTAFSTSFDNLAFSFKVVTAFSRPWPIFSPLKANQAPDFSTTLRSAARSKRSPSLEIPWP